MEFQKTFKGMHTMQLLEDGSVTLVHYVGDNSIAVDFAHRNAVYSGDTLTVSHF